MGTMDPFMLSTFAANTTMAFLAPQDKPSQSSELTPLNVALALAFIAFDSVLSIILGLGIASSLLVAASRCILQLSVMALVLDKVFATGNIFGVFGIAGELREKWDTVVTDLYPEALLNILGAIEATFNKSKRRFTNMACRIQTHLVLGSYQLPIPSSHWSCYPCCRPRSPSRSLVPSSP